MTNFLDFRNKVKPHIETIHRSARKQYPWCAKLTNVLVVVIIAGAAVWSVSKADDTQESQTAPEPFSVMGLVSATANNSFSLDNLNISEYATEASYTFDISTVEKIETKAYVPLQFSDIQIGDKIVVQGVVEEGDLVARRIIDFTATSTAAIVATTAPEISTSTSTSTSTSNSTGGTSSIIENVIDVVQDTVQNIVDAITGTTTPEATTTDEVASTTGEIVIDETSTTTEEIVIDETPTTTPEVVPETPPVTDTSTST